MEDLENLRKDLFPKVKKPINEGMFDREYATSHAEVRGIVGDYKEGILTYEQAYEALTDDYGVDPERAADFLDDRASARHSPSDFGDEGAEDEWNFSMNDDGELDYDSDDEMADLSMDDF